MQLSKKRNASGLTAIDLAFNSQKYELMWALYYFAGDLSFEAYLLDNEIHFYKHPYLESHPNLFHVLFSNLDEDKLNEMIKKCFMSNLPNIFKFIFDEELISQQILVQLSFVDGILLVGKNPSLFSDIFKNLSLRAKHLWMQQALNFDSLNVFRYFIKNLKIMVILM